MRVPQCSSQDNRGQHARKISRKTRISESVEVQPALETVCVGRKLWNIYNAKKGLDATPYIYPSFWCTSSPYSRCAWAESLARIGGPVDCSQCAEI